MSVIKSFAILLLTIGLPKIPTTEVPFMVLILPFFLKSLVCIFRSYKFEIIVSMVTVILWYTIASTSFLINSTTYKDFFFSFVLLFKFLLTFMSAVIIAKVLDGNFSSLKYWIFFQITVAVLSIISPSFYSLMMYFISPRSAAVFQNVFGLRTVGFGLFHVEGAITLVSFIALYMYVSKSFFSKILFFITFPIASGIARSSIVPFLAYSLFRKQLFFLLLIMILVVFFASTLVTSGVLYESFELARSFLESGSFSIGSTEAVEKMYTLPSELTTYLIGDGAFYNPNNLSSFYMKTDVGYMRLLYFAGVPFVIIFVVINVLIPLSSFYFKKDKIKLYFGSDMLIFKISSLMIFFIMNFKGLFMLTTVSLVIPFWISFIENRK
ncbi:conserved membrane hypothetical protein [Vibrio chagasii]|nr:conserved membrane hypothetical protein [Vibrio chagasii]CAH7153655.1 conserved membrane hypothetical protein [Vibrio chagasii]CAH7446661.1 conserved membrane hypothetical protein [Vibrio chagasii]